MNQTRHIRSVSAGDRHAWSRAKRGYGFVRLWRRGSGHDSCIAARDKTGAISPSCLPVHLQARGQSTSPRRFVLLIFQLQLLTQWMCWHPCMHLNFFFYASTNCRHIWQISSALNESLWLIYHLSTKEIKPMISLYTDTYLDFTIYWYRN